MEGTRKNIIYYLFIVLGMLQSTAVVAQNTIVYDIATDSESKQIFLFNTTLKSDSAPIFNKANKQLTEYDAYVSDNFHIDIRFFTLFEADGSALLIDTGGNFFTLDNENIEAKPKPLYINIDTLGAGKKNIVIETSSNDLENLKVFVIPYAKYRLAAGEPKVKTQMSFRIEEIIYGAKNKVPPRLLDIWKEEVSFVPENRKVLYNFSVILPQSMVNRSGERTLMVYDLANQVVAIYPHLNKKNNVLYRENIMTKTYIYKLYFNDEEVKKGFLHFLSPEDEQKKNEEKKAESPSSGDSENKAD